MSIKVIENEDAIWHTDEYDVILVGTSTYNMLTNGFQFKLKCKFPEIEKANQTTNYGDKRKLGKRMTVNNTTPIISLMYICNYPSLRNGPSIDYEALKSAIMTANAEFKGKKVMTTMIGCSDFDGNGDKDKVLQLLEMFGKDMDITVYDYHQLRKEDERQAIFHKLFDGEYVSKELYKEKIKEFNKIKKELYLEE